MTTPRLRELGLVPAPYHVPRPGIRGFEAVPFIRDAEDQETIDEIERLCRAVAVVNCSREVAGER